MERLYTGTLQNGQLGQKVKMPTTSEKVFYKIIRVVLCKKPREKAPNIREMRQF